MHKVECIFAHSNQILISNNFLQEKKAKLLEGMVDSRTGAGNTQDEPGTCCCARK